MDKNMKTALFVGREGEGLNILNWDRVQNYSFDGYYIYFAHKI